MQSCQTPTTPLTSAQIQAITDSASEVVNNVFEYSNNLDFESGFKYYSASSTAYFIVDGQMNSLSDLKKAYREVGPAVEALENTIESWNVQVLAADIVTFTLPVQLKLKLKGLPEFTGNLVWTATLKYDDHQWMIVQSHESWLNCAEVAAALTPAKEE